ncbi:Lrp/AsnC family transcriptional regulator [Stenoxybacter acetivorans]|uniref:Lrp/AsnC family transcriptional regulator n=1 Tax=Stenoxybacter acetivorans TaxID=422441 RepID=UPI00055B7CCD|nr:Lrp/AsnC family transcriptional regulator [Stenoxybacter acetivorans]
MSSQLLDKIDLKILQILQENGRLSNVELSERISLSASPCLRRLKHLEDTGIIQRYVALLNPSALGLGLDTMIQVSINKNGTAREEFEQSVQTWPSVLSCLALTGETDFILHAFFTDMTAFSHFVLEILLKHPSVQDAKSGFILKEIKNSTALPLAHLLTE